MNVCMCLCALYRLKSSLGQIKDRKVEQCPDAVAVKPKITGVTFNLRWLNLTVGERGNNL